MPTVHAYAAEEANGELKPFEYELGPLDPLDVDIAVETCGVCHSDLSMLQNDWGISAYPFVPGHEVIGVVKDKGDHVNHLEIGDRVGLGWHSGYCMMCDPCVHGDHNMCRTGEQTIVGRHGGFADLVRAKEAAVFKIPESVKAADAGPLLCGGITVFNPMAQFNLAPKSRVGVIGIGGLGHLALQFANAWGCHVTAFTSSESKIEEAKKLGAHDTINSRDSDAIQAAAQSLDLIISTVNVNLNWDVFLSTLKPKGRLHFVGALTEPLTIQQMPMIFNQLSLSASPVGAPGTMRDMLEFAGRHQISPVTEHFPMDKVNDAIEHLHSGKARYRIVLDRV